MIDCEKCKYYHKNCNAKFRCQIDVEQIRAEAIDDVISWFQKEFERQNDPNSKFVPSCVIKENIYDVLEQLKEQTDGMG